VKTEQKLPQKKKIDAIYVNQRQKKPALPSPPPRVVRAPPMSSA
jgi:hypothetical protein